MGGRGSGSSMTSSSSSRGSVRSLNGTTLAEANDNYWSSGSGGVRNKTNIARAIVGEGEYADRDRYAERHARQKEQADQAIEADYRRNPDNVARRADYEYMVRTRKSHSEYVEESKRDYDNTRNSTLAMASADVAKRMGYNISGGSGDFSASALNSVMGKANADALRRTVTQGAKEFLSKRRRR